MNISPKVPLPRDVANNLGPYYVYVLVDPGTDQIFYVGKGTGGRLLQHGWEADLVESARHRSPTVHRIREIRAAGLEPRHDIVRHGLEESDAFRVEAALIDCIDGLTNRVAGHGADLGRKTIEEYVRQYGAEPVEADAPPAVLIRLSPWEDYPVEIESGYWSPGSGYRPGMLEKELFDSTRAWWRLSPKAIEQRGIEHAVAVHEGVTRGIMNIGDWIQREDGRRAFTATPVEDKELVEKWVGTFGRRVKFKAFAQSPLIYWPLK